MLHCCIILFSILIFGTKILKNKLKLNPIPNSYAVNFKVTLEIIFVVPLQENDFDVILCCLEQFLVAYSLKPC